MGCVRLHVVLDIGDGLRLIFGFVELEGVFELRHPFYRRERHGPEPSCAAHKASAVRRPYLSWPFDARFGLRPLRGTEMVERGLGAFLRAIFLNQIKAG